MMHCPFLPLLYSLYITGYTTRLEYVCSPKASLLALHKSANIKLMQNWVDLRKEMSFGHIIITYFFKPGAMLRTCSLYQQPAPTCECELIQLRGWVVGGVRDEWMQTRSFNAPSQRRNPTQGLLVLVVYYCNYCNPTQCKDYYCNANQCKAYSTPMHWPTTPLTTLWNNKILPPNDATQRKDY